MSASSMLAAAHADVINALALGEQIDSADTRAALGGEHQAYAIGLGHGDGEGEDTGMWFWVCGSEDHNPRPSCTD